MNTRRLVEALAELALVVLSVVVVLTMSRLFDATTYLPEVITMAVASHAVAFITRRAGFSTLTSIAVSLLVLVAAVTVLFYRETAWAFIPTGDTLEALRADLQVGRDQFSAVQAPAPPLASFVLGCGILMWIAAFLADWAGFRLRSAGEAIAPATAVFVFVALLGDATRGIWAGGIFAAAVGFVLLTQRAVRQERDETWIADGAQRATVATLGVGALAAIGAVLIGVVGGPLLPGADSAALFDLTEIDTGPTTRVVTSPLVQIKASLVQQSDIEVFSVRTAPENRNYWRMMSLTRFDGSDWSIESSYDDASGPVPSALNDGLERQLTDYTITTSALGNIYLPVAYELAEIVDDGGVPLEYEADSGSLVAKQDNEDAVLSGYQYSYVSAVPTVGSIELSIDQTMTNRPDFYAEMTSLPDDFPQSVTDLALSLTDEFADPRGKALALQNFFRGGEFLYDLNVAAGHTITDIEGFLEIKAGYCEQFATTFAAMARAAGLPTQVAVGYSWGEWDEARQEYVVRGEHAHAWPEVYFDNIGWVTFDPTPGRASPVNSDVTGLAPEQANEVPELANGEDAAPTATEPPRQQDISPGVPPTTTPTDAATNGEPGRSIPWLKIATGLGVLSGLALIAPAIRWVRWKRRAIVVRNNDDGRSELAWDRALAALRMLDVEHDPAETPLEFASRANRRIPAGVGPLKTMAEDTTRLRFASPRMTVPADRFEDQAHEVITVCHSHIGRRGVITNRLDPRKVLH